MIISVTHGTKKGTHAMPCGRKKNLISRWKKKRLSTFWKFKPGKKPHNWPHAHSELHSTLTLVSFQTQTFLPFTVSLFIWIHYTNLNIIHQTLKKIISCLNLEFPTNPHTVYIINNYKQLKGRNNPKFIKELQQIHCNSKIFNYFHA